MGRDKATLEVGGEALLDRVIGRLRRVADPVILAGGESGLGRPGCISVADPVPEHGPLGGLVAALRASPHPLCAVVAVDMPDVSGLLLRRLAAEWAGEDAVVPVAQGRPQALHAVYGRSALPAAEEAIGGTDLSMHHLLTRLRVRFVDAAAPLGGSGPPDWAANLDTPADVEDWLSRSGGLRGRG